VIGDTGLIINSEEPVVWTGSLGPWLASRELLASAAERALRQSMHFAPETVIAKLDAACRSTDVFCAGTRRGMMRRPACMAIRSPSCHSCQNSAELPTVTRIGVARLIAIDPATTEIAAHMSQDEAECYRHHLAGAQAVLEYGVGGSTVLAAKRKPKSLYCVETDAAWLAQVRRNPAVAEMVASGAARLVHVNLGSTGRWGKPSKTSFLRWPQYARWPWRDGYSPELVMVDGRFRVSCMVQALLHGGDGTKIAVHDFWPREHFHAVLRFVEVVDRAGTLAVLRKKGDIGWRARLLAARHLFDRR
jgi:hypothetical protein